MNAHSPRFRRIFPRIVMTGALTGIGLVALSAILFALGYPQ
jgi:hypothetical protein